MPIKNYTTTQNEDNTVGKIMGLLAGKGARQVSVAYDESNRPVAVSFLIIHDGAPIPFKLPCNFDGVYKALKKAAGSTNRVQRNFERNPKSKEQSRRVAWRIIQDWVEAQMALIEAEQASMAEVFLPYAQTNGRSVFGAVMETFLRADRALTAGDAA